MSDDQDGCKWVNVSFGTGPPVVVSDKGPLNGCVCVLRMSICQFSHAFLMVTRKRLHYTFNGPFFRDYQVSRYQKGKTNLDFTEARDSE